MIGVGILVAVLAVVGLAPWWVRGDVAPGRAAALARAADGRVASVGRRPVDPEVGLALVAAACRSGASVVRALDAVGAAFGGSDGAAARSAAARLALGSGWDDAWAADVPGRDGRERGALTRVLCDALRPTWEHGAPPEPALRAATDQLRRDRAERSATAAGRLGVRLVLPLGLCYLPAFVLVGLVPVLVSYGVGLLAAG
ncbi:type II secretion system F family protein [Luteimicrobium sp. NPDC057192]|uniref:type II secretion system F family protein n=1 Tax=Luteimicrobium sp. NPDC057192 TaxID=3346042 RepID=UPI00362DAFBC